MKGGLHASHPSRPTALLKNRAINPNLKQEAVRLKILDYLSYEGVAVNFSAEEFTSKTL